MNDISQSKLEYLLQCKNEVRQLSSDYELAEKAHKSAKTAVIELEKKMKRTAHEKQNALKCLKYAIKDCENEMPDRSRNTMAAKNARAGMPAMRSKCFGHAARIPMGGHEVL